jgi:hypothetical protein
VWASLLKNIFVVLLVLVSDFLCSMFRLKRSIQRFSRVSIRHFSSEEGKAVAVSKPDGAIAKPVSAAAAQAPEGGSTFFQRFSSFLVGLGVGFGVSSYFIYNELVDSNEKLLDAINKK